MKNIILFTLLPLTFIGCQEKVPSKNIEIQKKEIEVTPVYTIKISFANPHEIYVNDMPFEKDFKKGSSTIELPINDLILKSGKQSIKITMLPDPGADMVDQSGLNYFDLKIYKYQSVTSIGIDGQLVREINLKDQKQSPIVVKEIFLDLEIPYAIKGWGESVDLSKENQTKLKNEVLLKYNQLRSILNKGDFEKFLSENEVRDTEVFKVFYNDQSLKAEDEEYMKDRISRSKNNMAEIKDFQVKTFGNGKVIALEKSDGSSALFGDDGKNIYSFMILLHRPKAGAPLEIIR